VIPENVAEYWGRLKSDLFYSSNFWFRTKNEKLHGELANNILLNLLLKYLQNQLKWIWSIAVNHWGNGVSPWSTAYHYWRLIFCLNILVSLMQITKPYIKHGRYVAPNQCLEVAPYSPRSVISQLMDVLVWKWAADAIAPRNILICKILQKMRQVGELAFSFDR
jgi:hypothetical protein